MELIKAKGFIPKQIILEEDAISCLPLQAGKICYLTNLPGFKVRWLRIVFTLLLCGNAAGNFVVKPMLLFQLLNPPRRSPLQKHHHPELSLVVYIYRRVRNFLTLTHLTLLE